jgi:hypothetical protein
VSQKSRSTRPSELEFALVRVSSLWSVGVAEAGARLSASGASAKIEKEEMEMGLARYMRVWLFVIGIVMGLGLEVLRRKRGDSF